MKIGTKSVINTTLKAEEFRIKKKFGQNFLVDQNILSNIVKASSATKDSLIIEIGPGLGSLTEHLLSKAKHVLAYEIDGELIPILQNTFKNQNVTLIHDDYLKRNVDEDINNLNMEFDKVVMIANLPYYITTPIIFKTLEECTVVSELLLMMQLEVARRLTSKPKTKDYNSLSVAIQYKTKATIALKVPRNVFIPAPNVDSAVVKIEILEKIDKIPLSEEHFYSLVRSSFTQRRKTLLNNLYARYNIEKELIVQYLEDLNLNPKIRAENLSVADFVSLSDYLYNLEII